MHLTACPNPKDHLATPRPGLALKRRQLNAANAGPDVEVEQTPVGWRAGSLVRRPSGLVAHDTQDQGRRGRGDRDGGRRRGDAPRTSSLAGRHEDDLVRTCERRQALAWVVGVLGDEDAAEVRGGVMTA